MKTKVILSLICYALTITIMVAYFMIHCHGKKADSLPQTHLSEESTHEAGSLPQSGAARSILVIRTDVSDTQPILYQMYNY